MIKLIFKIFLASILLFLVMVATLYWYGKSSTLDSSDYQQVTTYDNQFVTGKDTLGIVTYNIGYASGMTNNRPMDRDEVVFQGNIDKAIDLFNSLDVDILALQEVDFNADRSFNINQLEALAEGCEFNVALHVINWDKSYVPFPYWPPSVHFGKINSGQGILSRFPVNFHQRVVLDRPDNLPFYYDAFYIDRLIEISKLQIDSSELIVMNVHLEAFDMETRMRHAQKVLDHYNFFAEAYPVILLGDFNAPFPGLDADRTINTIEKGLNIKRAIPTEVVELTPEQHYTFSSSSPDRKIDHIYYNADRIEPVSARVLQEAGEISDHLPVYFKFMLIKDNN